MRGFGLERAGCCAGEIVVRMSRCDWTHSQPASRHRIPFLTTVSWNDLSGIRPPVGIEHRSQVAHRVERVFGEDGFHVSHLVETDAVLARDAAARIDARLHYLGH